MNTNRTFWVSFLAVLGIAGVMFAGYLLVAEERYEAALVVSVLLLGIAQLASAMMRSDESPVKIQDLIALRKVQETAFHETAGLRSRIEALEQRADVPQQPRGRARLLDEVAQARQDLEERPKQFPLPPKVVADPPLTKAAAPLPSEQLDLYLEPIIATANNSTAHYRAWMWLRTNGSFDGEGGDLYDSAERGGLRPALDVFALTRVIPVLRHFASRGRTTSVFIPLGKSTLAATAYLNEMIRLLHEEHDIAHLIVFEIEHAAIAGMSESGVQGLAQLARAGATLGLSGAASSGIEFAALKNLGFRSIEFTAGPSGTLPGWLSAARIAAAQGLDVLVSDVEDEGQAEAVRRWARFASGPHFAPPRLVKSDMGAEPLRARAA